MPYKIQRQVDAFGSVHQSANPRGDGDIAIVLESAEEKALQRIAAMEQGEQVDWVVIEPDESLDIETVRERIQQRGYTISA